MQKIVNEIINNSIKGVDTYRFRDATWLILTDKTQWVVELTDEGTLWFNYKFFDNILGYISVSARDGSEFITKWAEDYFFRRNDNWKVCGSNAIHRENKAVSVVHNGVLQTKSDSDDRKRVFYDQKYRNGYIGVYDVIGEGIKKTIEGDSPRLWDCKVVIHKGIKNTYPDMNGDDYDWSDEFKADKVICEGLHL